MSYLGEVDVGPSFAPFVAFQEQFGFVPNLFRAQTLLPRTIEAEAAIAASLLLKGQALSRIQKEYILLTVAAAQRSTYCVTAHHHMLHALGVPGRKLDQMISDYGQADLSPADTALLNFSVKLGRQATSVSREDVRRCFEQGLTDESLLEAILVTSLTTFLCTLAAGLGPLPDFEPRPIPPAATSLLSARNAQVADESSGPYLRAVERSPDDFAPFAFFREEFGFIPNIFRAQTLRPDVLEAEAGAIRAVLLTEDVLTRVQKECILLVISAVNLNTYCVAVHCEILRGLGVSLDDSDQIAVDHHQTRLSAADKALLDFALKLATRPTEMCREDVELLRRHGFAEEQILEGVVMTSLTSFLNTLQMGLGTTPDFPPRRVFRPLAPKEADPSVVSERLTGFASVDPDVELVTRVQSGDVNAFEELITRHSQLVYRTLVGILGDREEARDATQDTFLKAFQHVDDFARRSKFSTWLVSIASNTGIQRLRERKPMESLDEDAEAEEFRPRQVRAWADDPEQLYSQAEVQELVESSVMKLPASYRVVLVLRDLQQLSTEEAATALGLGIPALKARLFRGRLLLREILSPHFAEGAQGVAS